MIYELPDKPEGRVRHHHSGGSGLYLKEVVPGGYIMGDHRGPRPPQGNHEPPISGTRLPDGILKRQMTKKRLNNRVRGGVEITLMAYSQHRGTLAQELGLGG